MTGMGVGLALALSSGIVALSAFFVAVEFALIAARRHRLADAADRSASARAALRSTRELSLLLAGSQLGITLCTVALGAITKPAVLDLLLPAVRATGLPASVVDVSAFVLALVIVTFVHLVVGEMAPKSWAIAHPERSATLLALPMRLFLRITRPALLLLNGMANRCLRVFGVSPVDEVSSGHTADDLRALLDHSTRAGTLDAQRGGRLRTALDLYARQVAEYARPMHELVTVPPTADVDAIRAAARDSGHLRLVVRGDGPPLGVVHVRDTLAGAVARSTAKVTAAELMRPPLRLPASTPVQVAIGTMRRGGSHLALVDREGELVGLVTLTDLLNQLPLGSPAATRPR